eukprot:EG_transcript_19690
MVREFSGLETIVHFPRGLRFLVLDDSTVARRLLQFLLTSWCDPSVVHCLGEEEADVEAFMGLAMQGADVLVVDQHLVYSRTYLGTEIVQRLRSLGFRGFICIRSGDDGAEDRNRYLQHGANCSFGKDVPGAQFVTQLKEAYIEARQCLMYDDVASEHGSLSRLQSQASSHCPPATPPLLFSSAVHPV